MGHLIINMMFLYFPEDKTEYIPGTIICLVFMAFALLAMYFFFRKSKKEEAEFNEKYADRLKRAENISKQTNEPL